MPSSAVTLREIARWIAWDAFMFPYDTPSGQRERMEHVNEGEGFTVQTRGSQQGWVRTENVHLTTQELDLVFEMAAKIPPEEIL